MYAITVETLLNGKDKGVPVADFCLCDGEQVEEVYAYCNLHGLWKC